ncbi:Mevalonate kinase [Savitreella phatthalungensis]
MLRVSAPGKVILFGDHSVVYNRQAIAVALSLRTTLTFEPGQKESGLRLVLPDVDLDVTISWSMVPISNSDSAKLDRAALEAIESGFQDLSDTSRAAATAFLYLVCQLADSESQRLAVSGTYSVTSELPIGAGLGSSASVSVVIATALLLLTKELGPPHEHLSRDALSVINRWAFVGEQVIHGTPSGVDNTVATYGQGVIFQRGHAHRNVTIPSLPLVLTNTLIPRSTKALVAGVAALRADLPSIIEPILDAMHQLALQGEELLASSRDDVVTALGRLIDINQSLLSGLGVSHPAIEALVARNRERGHTKLVGAGGGGCVITLLDPSLKRTSDQAVETTMDEYLVTLGGAGVAVEMFNGINSSRQHW